MSLLKGFVVVASLVAAVPAFAQPARFTDGQYITAVRCRTLMAAPNLGKQDTSAIDAVIRGEERGRDSMVLDRADEAKATAQNQANHAGAYAKGELIAERNGVCQNVAGVGATTAGMSAAPATGAN